jgi:type I restriction enzyme, R subunit
MKFTESKLEQSFTDLLVQQGYAHMFGESIKHSPEEVIIEEDLITYLLTKYHSQQITLTEAKSIVLQLKTLPASDLYESNKTIMRWLSDGFILKRDDRNQKDIHIELIDFTGLEKQLAGNDLDVLAIA